MTDQQIEKFLSDCYHAAAKSPDPSNQNGAVIVSPGGQLLTTGYNDFCHGCEVTDERLQDRDVKLGYIEHAERNAIYAHTSDHHFMSTEGLTMVCPWAACYDCARGIIQARLKRLIVHKARMDTTPERWKASVDGALDMLGEAGVRIEVFEGPVRFSPDIIVNGEKWNPGNV